MLEVPVLTEQEKLPSSEEVEQRLEAKSRELFNKPFKSLDADKVIAVLNELFSQGLSEE